MTTLETTIRDARSKIAQAALDLATASLLASANTGLSNYRTRPDVAAAMNALAEAMKALEVAE